MPDVLLCQGTALALPLKDASVHVCVTSPPYYNLRDYSTGTWEGGNAACTHTRQSPQSRLSSTLGGATTTQGGSYAWQHTCGRCGATRVDQQLGLEATVEAYVAAMVQVFREVKRVLHPTGTVWINMGDSYNAAGRNGHGTRIGYKQGTNRASATGQDACRPQAQALGEKQLLGMPWKLAFALQADGWILRSEIIWHKVNPMPESIQDRPTRSHEQVFLFSKQARYYYDAEAVKEASTETSGWAKQRANGMDTWGYTRPVNDHAPHNHNGQGGTFGILGTRACRSVWSLVSEPLAGFQHYAAFPTALVRRCLLAGAPSRVCSTCGAPSRRVVERGPDPNILLPPMPSAAVRGVSPSSCLHHSGAYRQRQTTDHGFEATCRCDAGTDRAVILDPFCGSGTTLLVARELGHHAVGVDLSRAYLRDIARERLGLTALHEWQHGAAAVPQDYTALPLFGGTP